MGKQMSYVSRYLCMYDQIAVSDKFPCVLVYCTQIYICTYNYRDYRDYRYYLTARAGSLTGDKRVTGGKLPYFPGNFRVNTEITENILVCGNALPVNSEPSRRDDERRNTNRPGNQDNDDKDAMDWGGKKKTS